MKLKTLSGNQELAHVVSGWNLSNKEKFIKELEAQLQERMSMLLRVQDPVYWPNLQGRAAELQRVIHLLNGVVTV